MLGLEVTVLALATLSCYLSTKFNNRTAVDNSWKALFIIMSILLFFTLVVMIWLHIDVFHGVKQELPW